MPSQGAWSALEALSGRRLLVTGSTGFIGKVAVSMLLDRVPTVRIVVLVRPKPGQEPAARFLETAEASPAFLPLREAHGSRFADMLRERVQVLPGDATLVGLGLAPADLAALKGKVDALVHIAGLVALNPPLDESLRINAHGAKAAAEVAKAVGAKLVHVSTSYVAGLRSGPVPEEIEPLPFSVEEELKGCEHAIAELQARSLTEMASLFLRRAQERLRRKGREGDGPQALSDSAERLRRHWVEGQLILEGRVRARRWGWPNTYCYAKALGERLIASVPGLDYTIVRPSIVESAVRYPFAGWNEGLNTSAPVILAMSQGHVLWPAHSRAALDIIPVDMVCAGLLAATAAIIKGEHSRVYHTASSDSNPISVRRCMRFVGEYRKRHWRDHAPGRLWVHWLRTRLGVATVPSPVYHAFGVPAYRKLVQWACALLDLVPALGAPKWLQRMERDLGQAQHVIDTFHPFIHDIDCVFKTDNLRSLYLRLPPDERQALPWDPESIEWRSYWFDVHTEGLRRWVFPGFGGRRTLGPSKRETGFLVRAVRGLLAFLQRAFYAWFFECEIRGSGNVPASGPFLVAANHASHLDMGLIKYALGRAAKDLASLAAKDYFYTTPLSRFYFETFTNLIPIDRRAGFKSAFRQASGVLQAGGTLLIFPEGTRSLTGRLAPFKPSVGFIALHNKVDVLPVYLEGVFESLPKGHAIPRSRHLGARVGPVVRYEDLRRAAEGLPNDEAWRAATALIEEAVRRLEKDSGRAPENAAPAPPPSRADETSEETRFAA